MNADALANSERATGPVRVDKPHVRAMLQDFLLQQVCIRKRMVNHEGSAKTCAEGHFRLDAQSNLCAGNLARVSGNEMVDRLVGSESGNRRHDTGSIAGQEDYVLRMSGPLFGH